jgi:general secretion pathway protein K
MKSFIRKNEGVALILTILIISIVVSVTLQFNKSMWSNLHAATNMADAVKLRCIAKSGFNGGLAALYEDGLSNNTDTLREIWAVTGFLTNSESSVFEEGGFHVDISDLSGRIQINQLVDKEGNYNDTQKLVFSRFLSLPGFGLEIEDIENIMDAIKDWIDSDGETTRFGAEDSYYQSLERSYPCKNGPFEFLEELLLVRGITRELFYGTAERPGISSFISMYGNGKININTASSMVIRSLSDEIDEDRVEEILAYRGDENNDLSDKTWYKTVPGMAGVTMPDSIITTSSNYFHIVSEGFKGKMKKRIHSAVMRDQRNIRILSWKVE